MTLSSVHKLMLERQHFIYKTKTEEEYKQLFRLMQPVSPIAFSCPGDPPSIVHRSEIEDKALNNRLRASREIIKGRFQGGTVGYIHFDEFDLFIGAYKKTPSTLASKEQLFCRFSNRKAL